MNVSLSGFRAQNMQTFKMVGAGGVVADKAQGRNNKEKKDNSNSVAATLSLSNAATQDRSVAITKRYQAMKDATKKQIEALNERLQKASEQGNTKMVEQLTESIKELNNDYTALDEELSAALFEEQQRKAEEAKAKEEEAAKQREKEQEKHKPDEEKIKNAEKKTFEFFTKSDMAKESIQNDKIQKAMLERTKGRLEGEMATDSAAIADREQRHKARLSEIANSEYSGGVLVKKGHSDVPYVSDKTILTEKKRIARGSFTPDEKASVNELRKLKSGIENFESGIGATLLYLNAAVTERTEEIKDTSELKNKVATEDKDKVDKSANEHATHENMPHQQNDAEQTESKATNI